MITIENNILKFLLKNNIIVGRNKILKNQTGKNVV